MKPGRRHWLLLAGACGIVVGVLALILVRSMHSAMSLGKPGVELSWYGLHQEYMEDPVAADAKYKGKTIDVTIGPYSWDVRAVDGIPALVGLISGQAGSPSRDATPGPKKNAVVCYFDNAADVSRCRSFVVVVSFRIRGKVRGQHESWVVIEHCQIMGGGGSAEP